jgi:hypothetical protein
MALDEKRYIIVPLLGELRKYNDSIGSYEKSTITGLFDYSVKLSNGIIRLPGELVDDYENAPDSITLNRIKSAASAFTPSNSTIVPPSSTSIVPAEEPMKKSKRPIILVACIAIVVIIIGVIATILINRKQQRDEENAARINQERIDSTNTAINQARVDSEKTARINQEEAAKTVARNTIRLYVTARANRYSYKLIGGISNLKITVANNTTYTMDVVKVRVTYLKQSGGVYKYEELNFNGILPRSQMTLNAPDSDRGTHVQFGIETISSSQLGL